MRLEHDGQQSTGDIALDSDLRDIQILDLPDGPVLLAMTGGNGGMVSYAIDAGGGLILRDIQHFPDRFATLATGNMEPLTLDGKRVVIFGGDSAGLAGCALDAAGHLTETVLAAGPGEIPAILTSGQAQGLPFAYLVEASTGGLSSYRITSTGQITPLANPGITLQAAAAVQSVQIDGQTLLLTADLGRQGVASYSVNPATGALQHADTLGMAQGLGINTPTAMEVISAHGATFVLLAAAGSGSLSVMQLGADGALTPTDHILDTLDTRFGGTQALGVVEADGHVFVVAGGNDDGLSLFTLLPNGQLLHLQTIAHADGDGLVDITDITAARIDNAIRIFVTSELSGIGQFSISLATLGEVRRASAASASLVTGTPGDDQLIADGAGPDTLIGGAGDDILVSASAGTVMEGGAGADTFVIRPATALHRITDFEPGRDRIDLGALPMLRSLSQLTITPQSDGARIAFGSTEILVQSLTGLSLNASALFGAGLTGPDRVLVLAWVSTGTLIDGTANADRLSGTSGDDTLNGGDGDDRLIAGEGDDLLHGANGNDWIDAGIGNDEVWAGQHNDTVLGGSGDDTIGGEAGNDTIWAGEGNDLVFGGAGDDTIGGEAGSDTIWARDGNDLVFGGAGNDTIGGEAGNDTIWARDGNDLVFGGLSHDTLGGEAGNDTIWAGTGNDRVFGGAGNDTIWAGGGNDLVFGGPGDDTIGGEVGNDTIWARNGNDLVFGGPGDDTIGGEAGNDTIWARNGNDLVFGGAGNDTIRGEAGNDTIWARSGNDLVFGGPGDDTIGGEAGDDTIWARDGNDLVFGGSGDDLLYGDDGADTIQGGAGNDSLWGGLDDDLMMGGSEDDTFVFSRDSGADRITDFTPGIDHIRLEGTGLTFDDLSINDTMEGAIVGYGSGTILLENVTSASLSWEDFGFA